MWWSAPPPPPPPPTSLTRGTQTARTRAGTLSHGRLQSWLDLDEIFLISRTDVKKLQEVRSSGEICDVNIILTNPDLLQLCGGEEDAENRNQESSPERTSYR